MDSLSYTTFQYGLRLNSYVDVACLTLLAYDTVLNIRIEYRHIWQKKWGLIKCLYLLSRYGTFLTTTIVVLEALDKNINPSSCNILSKFESISSGFGMGFVEVILIVRTHALYERSKKLLGFLVVLWLSISGVSAWALMAWTKTFEIAPSLDISCDAESSNNILLVCYSGLLAGETIIVLLTLWKGYRAFSLVGKAYRPSHLVIIFYRDGISYYLAMLVILITVAVLQLAAQPPFQSVGLLPLRVMHSILACHLVIHVRVVASEDETDTAATKSQIVFAVFPAESGQGVDSIV